MTHLTFNELFYIKSPDDIKAVVCINKKNVSGVLLSNISTTHQVIVEITSGDKSFIFISAYFHPSRDIKESIKMLEKPLKFINNSKPLIICVDCNAHSTVCQT